MKQYKISRKNLPQRFGILAPIAWATILDYWNAPVWLWYVIFTIFGIGFIVHIYNFIVFDREEIDLFSDITPPPPPTGQKKWSERLAELQKQQNKN